MSSPLSIMAAGPRIVALSGSPSPESKTAMLAQKVIDELRADAADVQHIRLSALNGLALLRGETSDQGIADAIAAVDEADGVVVATPIFKSSYSGLLKIFLDVLPQFGLAGKAVLPLATGGSLAHVLALDYGLRPVLQSMGARHIVQAVFVASAQALVVDQRLELAEDTTGLLNEALLHFREALRGTDRPSLLGHPRPARAVTH